MIRHRDGQIKAAEPAVGQIITQLLTQTPLGWDRVNTTDQRHPDEKFRVDRWSSPRAVVTSQRSPEFARLKTSVYATQQVVCGQHGFYGAAGRHFPPTATGWSHHGAAPLSRVKTKEQPGMSGIFQQARSFARGSAAMMRSQLLGMACACC